MATFAAASGTRASTSLSSPGSRSGSDDYESKLSLVPLIFGTLKGTFYAMLLAVPLALGAAVYVSQFASPRFRAWIKPAIEIMACVPSVVLGFLVGLWLAPFIRDWLLAFFLGLFCIPVVFVLFLLSGNGHGRSPEGRRRVRSREFLLAALLLGVGLAAAAWLSRAGGADISFGGNVVTWLSSTWAWSMTSGTAS